MFKEKTRGFLKLRKGIIKNLHPDLIFLDETSIPFEGFFQLDYRFFYINYGFNNLEKGVMTKSVPFILQVFKEYEQDNK